MSKWLDLKINVEIQVSPMTDNEKDTKYKLDLTFICYHRSVSNPVFFKHRGIVDCRHSAKVRGSAT